MRWRLLFLTGLVGGMMLFPDPAPWLQHRVTSTHVASIRGRVHLSFHYLSYLSSNLIRNFVNMEGGYSHRHSIAVR